MVLPQRQGLYDPENERDACGVGFVAHIKNQKSHAIIEQGLKILENLEHRGATGYDPLLGDGAGILIQIPDQFLREEMARQNVALPPVGMYGVGMVFLPRGDASRRSCEAVIERAIRYEGQVLLGWRDVPTDNRGLAQAAKDIEPVVRQVFIAPGPGITDTDALERKLYILRKAIGHSIQAQKLPDGKMFYVPSMSARTVVYKGMLLANQVGTYYLDLQDSRAVSAMALAHQRFSTNTFPTWDLAHPFRMIAHNGEINALRGNVNWMRAREHGISSPVLGADLEKVWPLIYDGQSDSASFDNALELLVMGGYSLAHAMMMLIPEAWAGNPLMDEERRAFYEYHMALMEPWDGPAAVAFTDGRQIGATLDRNGLRPARYLITDDDLGRDVFRDRRAADRRGAHRQEVAPAAGQDVPHRPGAGPHHRRHRTQAHHVDRQALPQVDRAVALLRRRPAGCQGGGRAQRPVTEGPAGFRLFAGRLQVHPRTDGDPGRGSHRRDGQRQPAAGALRPGQAAVQLLQAAVRPGDEPADRSDPRGNRHVADLAGQPQPEPARRRRNLPTPRLEVHQPVLTPADMAKLKKIDN
jgi:glutamate synthase domain-containing protein 1